MNKVKTSAIISKRYRRSRDPLLFLFLIRRVPFASLESIEERHRGRDDPLVLVFVQQLEEPRADGGRHAEDDSLGDSVDRVGLTVIRRVEQVIRRLLELWKRRNLVIGNFFAEKVKVLADMHSQSREITGFFRLTDAKLKTDSRIFARPWRVMPRTSPRLVI